MCLPSKKDFQVKEFWEPRIRSLEKCPEKPLDPDLLAALPEAEANYEGSATQSFRHLPPGKKATVDQ